MIQVEHKLRFITEFDETHPIAKDFLRLDEVSQVYLLESMLKDLLTPALKPVIDELNARGTYAILKVAE
jgi:hypothetical protein